VLNENSPIPLYVQLKHIFLNRIENSVWDIDTKIPTEKELCIEFNVSRITVRQALDELERRGHIYRKQGNGTYIKRPIIEQRLFSFYSFSEEIKKSGRKPGSVILDFNIVKCTLNIAESLQVEVGSEVLKICRLRLADEEPFALETSYLPYSMCYGLTALEVQNNGLYSSLSMRYMIEPSVVEESFEAIIIPLKMAEKLNVSKRFPGIHLERITRSGRTIFEYCDCIIRGDKYKYSVKLNKY